MMALIPEEAALKILVVDDSAFHRSRIIRGLRTKYNAEIAEAEDGLQALNMVQKAPTDHFDVVFTDIDMPHCTRYEFAKILRTTHQLPIVAVSGRDVIERANFAAVVHKPFLAKSLHTTVDDIFFSSPSQ